MRVVYIENVFFLNWIIDYFLLLGSAGFAGAPLYRKRIAICSVLGGLYAVAVLIPQLTILSVFPVKLIAGCLMALAAYWPSQKRWHLTALFFLLSSAMAGLVLTVSTVSLRFGYLIENIYYMRITWPVLLTTTVIMYLLLRVIFRQSARHREGELMVVTVSVQQQQRQLTALHDTGNTLRDPVNGRAVLVLERKALKGLWTPEIEAVLGASIPPEEKMVRLHHNGIGTEFTLLPFRSVGVSSGLLLAVRSDYIKVGKRTYPNTLIALCDSSVSDGGCYQALWGGEERGEAHREVLAADSALDSKTQQAG